MLAVSPGLSPSTESDEEADSPLIDTSPDDSEVGGFVLAGFSIEGGTRRLIAAYFGIYSRLLCV